MATSIVEEDTSVLGRTAMFAGEVLVPGASEFVAGNIGSGVGHLLVAGAATVLLGPTMPVVAALVGIGVRLNSYQDATTGRTLYNSARRSVEDMVERRRDRHAEPAAVAAKDGEPAPVV